MSLSVTHSHEVAQSGMASEQSGSSGRGSSALVRCRSVAVAALLKARRVCENELTAQPAEAQFEGGRVRNQRGISASWLQPRKRRDGIERSGPNTGPSRQTRSTVVSIWSTLQDEASTC
ncbi:hypothetical protein FI667_g10844, partial [Globisporangium splendens]